MNTSNYIKSLSAGIRKHESEIKIGLGIAGFWSAGVMAIQATPKALILLEKEKREQNVEQLTPIDTVKTIWKCYIPAVAIAAISTICIIDGCKVNSKKNAALATAYSLSESAFRGYREKTKEIIGEKKEQTIIDAVAEDKLKKYKVQNNEVIMTDKGTTLCFDSISGRYFKSDRESIRQAANDVNRVLNLDRTVSLNDFYSYLGLPSIKIGDMLGWNIDLGSVELSFSSQLTDDGIPCLVINYYLAPTYEFDR